MKQPKCLSNLRVLIIGCGGMVANLMIDIFADMGIQEMEGIDRDLVVNTNKLKHFIQLDVTQSLNQQQCEYFCDFDIILFAIPFETFKPLMAQIASYLKSNAILIDFFSIKTIYLNFIQNNLKLFPENVSFISMNPLFRPDILNSEKKFLVCTYRGNNAVDDLIHQFKNYISVVFLESFDEHDRLMSFVQVAPHFLVLVLSVFLTESGVAYEKIKLASTTFMEAVFCIVSRMLVGGSHVYWEIQSMNNYSKEVREKLMQTMETMLKLFADNNNVHLFENKFAASQNYFVDRENYNDLFLKIFKNNS